MTSYKSEIILSEDELILKESNDELKEKELDFAIVEQDNENMLAYSITGLYKDEKKTKYMNRLKLRNAPPILNVKSSDGAEVNFNLTKEFSQALFKSLSEVNRAYSGYVYVSDKDIKKVTMKERIENLKARIKKHPIVSLLTLILFFLFIYLFFII